MIQFSLIINEQTGSKFYLFLDLKTLTNKQRKSGVGAAGRRNVRGDDGVTDLVPETEDGFHDGDEVGLGREVLHPEHPLELLQDDDGRRAAHEPGDGRTRQEIHYEP
jgi:hypothetical protein